MENRRMCHQVIDQMLDKIPEDKVEFINDLKESRRNNIFHAPEQVLQWRDVQSILEEHIVRPTENWEYEVLSIFTRMTVSELKDIV